MHEIKRKIIQYLRYHPGARFSELKIESVDSNKLSYHLNELRKQGLVECSSQKYSLTSDGKKLLNFLTEETAELRKQPVSVVAIVPLKAGKVLLQERLKEPLYGYWLLVGGKVEFGETLADACKRELMEETGLIGKPKLFGMLSLRVFEKETVSFHVHLYCYTVTDLKGKLIADIKEGKNRWFAFKDVPKLKMHPSDYLIFTKRSEKCWLAEEDEYFDGEKLLRKKLTKL